MKLGLARVVSLLDLLGGPHRAFPCVLVGGTNGKGSVAALLADIFRAAGYRTGLYTSPHLVRPEERIAVDGTEISREDWTLLFDLTLRSIEQGLADGTLPHRPTYFETMTALAFQYFATRPVEMAILEVGLGGRLDATNVVRPEVSVITSVSYDHQQYLGNTLEEIAFEKAGILKPGIPAVVGPCASAARETIRSHARDAGSPVVWTEDGATADVLGSDEGRYRFDLRTQKRHYGDLKLRLAGRHQVVNAATALLACELLAEQSWDLTEPALRRGLAEAFLPGRLEAVRPGLTLDGAHNEEAARALEAFWRDHLPGPVHLVFGAMRDKDIPALGRVLFPRAQSVTLTRVHSPRGEEPERIAALLPEFAPKYAFAATVGEALAQLPPEGTTLVAGSFYLVGEVKEWLASPQAHSQREQRLGA